MARLAALLAASPRFAPNNSQFMQSSVAVEKGTKAVICVNFSACGKRRFNNLRANFVREIPRKEFFNTHRRFRSLRGLKRNGDLYEAAGAAGATACSRTGRWGGI